MPVFATTLAAIAIQAPDRMLRVLNDWRDDGFDFLRYTAPKILAVLIVAFVLTRLMRLVARHLSALAERNQISALRSAQFRTLSGVSYSVGLLVITSIAAMQILALLGVNMGPLLASAGVVGLAIGFGAQTLVKDFINGFFILAENQYDIGDTVKIAGVQGVVENMTLRRTVLRDFDGTVHTVPSSEIKVVSNLTRDWTQVILRVSASFAAPSDKVLALLKATTEELAADPAFSGLIVAQPQVLGVDKLSGSCVEYLLTVKTRPNSQDAVRRELQRRIKAMFERNKIEPGDPHRLTLAQPIAGAAPFSPSAGEKGGN
jgi:small conductance mechanosensitive channel